MNSNKSWRTALAGCLLTGVVVTAPVLAAPVASVPEAAARQLENRYPPGSIESVAQADAALQDVEQARTSVLAAHAAQEAVCYPKFWVSSCLERAAEVKRSGLVVIRRVEVEAARFKRQAKVTEHDKAMEERRQEEAQNAPQRLIKEQDFQKAQAEKEAAQAKAVADDLAARAREDDVRQKEALRQQQHDAKLKKIRAQQQAESSKRADKVAAYEKKQQDARARQQEVEKKRLEHEKKVAASASATPASSAAAPANNTASPSGAASASATASTPAR